MKKKYYQGMKDRMDESRAMERKNYRARMMFDEPYAGMDPRRRQEMEDAGMIHEDHSAIANLPQGVIMREYPKPYYHKMHDLDDTSYGIDMQVMDDVSEMAKHEKPEKY